MFKHKISLIMIMVLVSVYFFRFMFLYPYASSWDQVDFVFALSDFDLLKMQPHFPGYPFFIIGGTLVNQFIKSGSESLSFLNQFLMLTASVPMYLLAKQWLSSIKSGLIVLLVQSLAYPTIMIAQPMSEGAAIAIMWWFLWSLIAVRKNDSLFFEVLPFFLYSVLLGIRLSYIAFGVGLLFHVYYIWKKTKYNRLFVLIGFLLVAILFQFAWVGALASNVGGLSTLWKVAFGFSEGHFTEWGGTANEGNLFTRFVTLIIFNIFWVGWSAENICLTVLIMIAIVLSFFVKGQKSIQNGVPLWAISISTGAYFIWALLAQNIDKPRHIIPIAMIGMFLIGVKLILNNSRFSIIICSLLISGQAIVGLILIKEQVKEQPAVYQLANDLSQFEEPFIIYTWEETRVFEYLHVPFVHKRVLTYEVFQVEANYYNDRKVFVTDKVIEGFKKQGINVDERIKKVSTYKSNDLFDPVYSKVTLYQWLY